MKTSLTASAPLIAALSVAILTFVAGCGGSDDARLAAESAASSAAAAQSSAAAVSSSQAASAAAASAAAASSAADASRSAAAAAMASAAASLASEASVAAAAASTARTAPGIPSSTPEALSAAAAAVSAAAAAAGTASADPDTPGEDDGARCPGNEQYAAEQPTGMRADVAAAWLAVAAAGEAQGITMCLADGKRSRAQQQATYDDYVVQFGQAMADQYVLPPEKSAHVQGLAVDVQPYAAYTWLEGTAGRLGFCRIYDNEAWHFEYNPSFPGDGCPARLPHPSA